MKTSINSLLLVSLIFLAIVQTKENNDLKKEYTAQLNISSPIINSTKSLTKDFLNTVETPKPLKVKNYDYDDPASYEDDKNQQRKFKPKGEKTTEDRPPFLNAALQLAARQGLESMIELYNQTEPDIAKKGQILDSNHPATLLSKFSAPDEGTENNAKAAFALLVATKTFRQSYKQQILDLGRQAPAPKITFRRTPLEGLCPPRDPPICLPAAQRYRTHDGTCNNFRRPRWGAAQMPFNRFLPPEYSDGIDSVRGSIEGGPLASARFVSLVVHGADDGEAPVTLMFAQWGQLIDHDLTSTAQPRSINGSVPRCCGADDSHPSCFPIKVPKDDPWLAPLKVRCLEFLRSAPAQRRDCLLSWREQTNQVTSYLDASPIYSSNARTSDSARVFRNGLLLFGRGNPHNDICLRGGISRQCIRAGDPRSNEQPGLLALHHVWAAEHNRIALELSDLNAHWSDEKVYQEARRIIGAMFQHITYREFLPLVLGKEVCKLFELELLAAGYYRGYDPHINPTVANSFAAAAFRFGHSLIQGSYMRCDRNHNFLDNNVTLHEEFTRGDLDSAGSLHRLLRGLAVQRSQMRDEFITPELTNHLFQTGAFPFGLDLAAINIQRGRDHGIPPYTSWREPCGLSPIHNWEDLENVVGPGSAHRISHAYRNVHDIDLFVGGIAERPVIGGLIGPTFACIIAQQFSYLRKGDRFWYENGDFENSFTPAQLHSIRRVTLAQILCRAVGGGTLQPHIFIPHDAEGNERLPCGIGPLAPIDLLPWVELEPFLEKHNPQQHGHDTTEFHSNTHNITFINRLDLTSALTGTKRPLQPNLTKIHDKLDFKQKLPQTDRVHNKLDANKRKRLTNKTETANPTKKNGPTKRTVIVNNKPILLRHNSDNTEKQNVPQSTQTPQAVKENTRADARVRRSTNHNRTATSYSKQYKKDRNRGSQKSHEIVIETSDYSPYEIEINIKQTNRKKVTPTYEQNDPNLTLDKYNTGLNTGSSSFNYELSSPTRRPSYERSTDFTKFTKPPTIIYLNEQDDFRYSPSTTTKRPSFPLNHYSFSTNDFHTGERHKDTFGNNAISNIDSFSGSSSFFNKDPNVFSSSVNSDNYSKLTGTISNSGGVSSFNINIKPPAQPDREFIRKGGTYSRPNNIESTKKPYYFSTSHLNTQSPFSSRPNSFHSSTSDFNVHHISTTYNRRYYQTTSHYQQHYKEIDHDNDIPEVKSLVDIDDDDYDVTTYNPITMNETLQIDDYYDDDYERFDNFDKDGYLRPEHMKLDTLQQDKIFNKTNITTPMDDFVLPILNETDTKITVRKNTTLTNNFDNIPRHSNSDILAESSEIEKSSTIPLVPFAPLNVLTRPERPDKWAIINPPAEQRPLPVQPEIKLNTHAAKEFPRLIQIFYREIQKRFKPTTSTISP